MVQWFLTRLGGLSIKPFNKEQRAEFIQTFKSVHEASGLEIQCQKKGAKTWHPVTNVYLDASKKGAQGSPSFWSGRMSLFVGLLWPHTKARSKPIPQRRSTGPGEPEIP